MTTRKESVDALRVRHGGAAFGEPIKILDEFVALTRCCPLAISPLANRGVEGYDAAVAVSRGQTLN